MRTFGGLGDGLDREACRQGLVVARKELEVSLLRRLVAGATWTAERAARHRLRDGKGCPRCGAPEEHGIRALWSCAEWQLAREPGMPWVERSGQALLKLGAPRHGRTALREQGSCRQR